MQARTHPVSGFERVASLGTAIGVTVGTALLVLAAPARRFVMPSVFAPVHDAERTVEHLVYIAPPTPALTVPPKRPIVRSSIRPKSRGVNASPVLERPIALPPDSASFTRVTTAAVATSAPALPETAPSRSTAGAPVASATVGFTHGPVEGVPPPAFKPLPPTQAELDAQWRDKAFEIAAARGAGEPVRVKMAGGSVAIPLPFGGPSRKQRERDRAIEAQMKAMRALRQPRIDSVVAARKRRLADSLARVTDSLRLGPRARP